MQPIAAFIALVCLVFGGVLAAHYPIAPALMSVVFVGWSVAVFLRPAIWLFALPALLPVIGFASWTGWLTFEEFDLLALGAAVGGYASLAIRGRNPPRATASLATGAARSPVATDIDTAGHETSSTARLSAISGTLVALFGVSAVIALGRGLAAAGAIEFDAFNGYYDALNSVRLAKSFALAVLLMPLLQVELRDSGPRAFERLAWGLACALGLGSLAVVWERLAFPGLLDFSSDYRTTGMFWEMHVGGAALDGFLALTVPFAIRELLHQPSRARWIAAGALTAVAGYACLATFSRGLYLAVPISLGVLTVLALMQRESFSARSAATVLLKLCLLATATAAASFLVFRAGGYRSLLALLVVVAVALPLASVTRAMPRRGGYTALGLGVLAGAAGIVAAA